MYRDLLLSHVKNFYLKYIKRRINDLPLNDVTFLLLICFVIFFIEMSYTTYLDGDVSSTYQIKEASGVSEDIIFQG